MTPPSPPVADGWRLAMAILTAWPDDEKMRVALVAEALDDPTLANATMCSLAALARLALVLCEETYPDALELIGASYVRQFG